MQEIVNRSLASRHWAVIGASPNPDRYSYKIIQKLLERGYTVYPVRPGLSELLGLEVYPDLGAVPRKPDVIDMVVNPSVGIRAMKQAAEMGVKTVWLQPGAESEEIHQFAEEHGIDAIEACVLAVLAINREAGFTKA